MPSRTHSPIAASSPHVDPSINDDGSDFSSQELLTQPPHITNTLPPATPPINRPSYAPAPPQLLTIDHIPIRQKAIIQQAIHDLYSINSPRDFQIEAINHLAFSDDASLIVIRRTADGKSLIPLATSVLRGGIALILVPLHGLGSDQVEKAAIPDKGVEAYYVDEHRNTNAKALHNRLSAFTTEEADHATIILFVSPSSLKSKSKSEWNPLFHQLASDGLIRLIAIDEAHAVEQAGRSFRTEFIDAVTALKTISEACPRPIPRLAMSATFRQEDYDRVISLLGMSNTVVMSGPLSRRNTAIKCIISGAPSTSLIHSANKHFCLQPDKQQLWYFNSKMAAEGSMLKRADQLLDKHLRSRGLRGCCTSFTGGDGLKIKTSIMDAFTSFANLPGDPALHDDGTVTLAKIHILLATSAANCGISSNHLSNVLHKGVPYNLYDVVQEMGRANRTQTLPDCHYDLS